MFDQLIGSIPSETPRPISLLPGLSLRAQSLRRHAPIIFFMLFMGLFPFLIFLGDSGEQLNLHGKTIDARVTTITERNGDREVAYAFTPPGDREYKGACRCTQGTPAYDLKPGDSVSVLYLPSDPTENRLAGRRYSQAPPFFVFFIFPLFIAVIFLPFVWPQIAGVFSARRLFTNGSIAKGTVVFVKKPNMPSWPSMMTGPSEVYIAYRLPSGEAVEGKASCTNEWLVNQLAPGSSVNIAYSPGRTAKVVLLEAYLR
jgi:hypothetical protein